MHVLYFHQHFTTPHGSSGTRSYAMARRLVERGHRVTMVCGSYEYGDSGLSGEPVNGARKGVVDGINVIELALPYSNRDGFVKRTWTFARFALSGIGLALTIKYDLLFATSTPLTASLPGIIMKLFKKRPFVFEVRDLWPELPREMKVITNPFILKALDILEWLSYHSADKLIALSPGIAKGIERRGINRSKITLIPNGCDLDLFKPNNSARVKIDNIDENDFVAVFTGVHGMANGLDAVLSAAAVLKERGRNNIRLLFVGDGMLKPALKIRAEREKLDNCVFMDPVPKTELAKLISRADSGMMILANVPAFYYGTSPNKFFDYIACGFPVINNYPGWLAEIIDEHECGIAVPPENPEAFADALMKMADNRADTNKMGKNARKLAETKFDRVKLADEFVDLLEEKAIQG